MQKATIYPEGHGVKNYKAKADLLRQILEGNIAGATTNGVSVVRLNEKKIPDSLFKSCTRSLRACLWNCTGYYENVWEKIP